LFIAPGKAGGAFFGSTFDPYSYQLLPRRARGTQLRLRPQYAQSRIHEAGAVKEGDMTAFLTGLAMVGVALFMFVIAIPRQGEVVGFLRGRSTLETAYTLVLLSLLVVGTTAVIAQWAGT
jgi:hypothetical protein